jgi:hypothetical protein
VRRPKAGTLLSCVEPIPLSSTSWGGGHTMPDPRIGRLPLTALLVALVAGGCATSPKEAADRAECKAYARPFEHSGRMKDACLISRGYE